jgi:hypothetical protein
LPLRSVPAAVLRACVGHLQCHDEEAWHVKAARTGRIMRGAALPISEHDGLLASTSTKETG